MLRCRLDRLRKFPTKSETGFRLDSSRRQLSATAHDPRLPMRPDSWCLERRRDYSTIVSGRRFRSPVSLKVYKVRTYVCTSITLQYHTNQNNLRIKLTLKLKAENYTMHLHPIGMLSEKEMLKKRNLNDYRTSKYRFDMFLYFNIFESTILNYDKSCDNRDNYDIHFIPRNNSRF